jgi:hypothetical protein
MNLRTLTIALCAIGLLCVVQATVFEASSSEDVDLFIQDNEKETIGLLFYDSKVDNKENQDKFARLITNVLGIFMSEDQYGRAQEEWVELYDEKLHLMRVDVRNPDNLRTKVEFNIEDAPFIVIINNKNTVLRDKLDDGTYDKVRAYLESRPNIKEKSGPATIKSFSLEPDAEAPQTAPTNIQSFRLDKDEPTEVQEPDESVNALGEGADVLSKEGKWEKRQWDKRTIVPWEQDSPRFIQPKKSGYEIPTSGIKNQEQGSRVRVVDKLSGSQPPRSQTVTPTQRPTGAPVQGQRPATTTQAPQQSTASPGQPSATPAQSSSARPAQATAGPVQSALKPTAAPAQARPAQPQGATQARPVQGQPAQARPATAQPAQARPATAQPVQGKPAQATPAATTQGAVKPAAQASTVPKEFNQRNPYHQGGYRGYGELNDMYRPHVHARGHGYW